MRNETTFFLPTAVLKTVHEEVKAGKYTSLREFLKDTLRIWKEKKLLKELRHSQKEFAQGKGKILHNFDDLD